LNTFDKIYEIVTRVPEGKVTTYGAISKVVGVDPRVVGFALHANKEPERVPCHRVINSKGQISSGYAFGGFDAQRKMLQKEGVKFDRQSSAVDLNKFGFFLF
jgi:methylated-DNA-protein-cysteine methyltransferase related protein